MENYIYTDSGAPRGQVHYFADTSSAKANAPLNRLVTSVVVGGEARSVVAENDVPGVCVVRFVGVGGVGVVPALLGRVVFVAGRRVAVGLLGGRCELALREARPGGPEVSDRRYQQERC